MTAIIIIIVIIIVIIIIINIFIINHILSLITYDRNSTNAIFLLYWLEGSRTVRRLPFPASFAQHCAPRPPKKWRKKRRRALQ